MRADEIAIEKLREALQIIILHKWSADFESGATLDEIVAAEELLGVALPASYKEFLTARGVGGFSGREFYGIVPGRFPGASTPDAVWLTLRRRSEYGLPPDFIVVGSTGHGSLFCIDTSRAADGEAPVVEWDRAVIDEVAESFGAFFLQEIKEAMETGG